MNHSRIYRTFILLTLLILLCPAVLYLTSPWWAPGVARWAAAKLWQVELNFDSASFNPFTMSLHSEGGSFKGPRDKGFQASGDLYRLIAEIDVLPLLKDRRIKDLSIEIATLKITTGGGGFNPLSYKSSGSYGNLFMTVGVYTENDEKDWVIDRLLLMIDRGVLCSPGRKRGGEISIDLDFKAVYENVNDIEELAGKILEGILSKAAFGFLTERFL